VDNGAGENREKGKIDIVKYNMDYLQLVLLRFHAGRGWFVLVWFWGKPRFLFCTVWFSD